MAFFVPRFYVCETRSSLFNGSKSSAPSGGKDPMAELIDGAEITIPHHVRRDVRLLHQLGWSEAFTGDSGRAAGLREPRSVRKRIQVSRISVPHK